MSIVYLIIGLLIGGIIGYLIASRKLSILKTNMELSGKHAEELKQVEISNWESQIATLRQEAKSLNDKIESLSSEKESLISEKTMTEANVKSLTEKLAQQKEEMTKLHEQFAAEFKNLANDILKTNSSDFKKMSEDSIKNLVNPLSDHLKEFREKVEKYYGDESNQRYSLKEAVEKLVKENQKISEDANNLANALKGESKTQGDWGEMILEDILQKSGLVEGEQFVRQDFIRDENGETLKGENGHKMQPDVIVMFPDKRKIIIDSKVSLKAYTEYATTNDDDMANLKLKEHIDSVRRHIDELSKKDYSTYMDEAPDFVMMFIPNEPAYYLALQADGNIWNYAYDKKVVLMNPTNLIMALRLALDLWRRNAQERNIMAIVKAGSDLYDKFVGFTEDFKSIGSALDKANNTYSDAMKKLTTGNGNIVKRVKDLENMGITPKKKIAINSSEEDLS